MDETPDGNGAVWVTFGGSRVELDIAQSVLTLMKEREPEHLGALIGEAYCGVEVKVRRSARA